MTSSFEPPNEGSVPPPPPPSFSAGPDQNVVKRGGNNGKALASMICGIVGIVFFGIILGPIAIALGLSAKKEIARTGQSGRGMATAGIVLGIVAVAFFFITIAFVASS